MSKFFIPRENINENTLTITGGNVNHILKVLRLKKGDEIICCDGMGNDYRTEIIATGKAFIECKITEKMPVDTESNIKVTIIQGIPKASKMDYIIQKTTELGAYELYPCRLSRCVSKIDDGKKTERWQKIAEEAAKQSGRGIIPKIHDPIDLKDAIDLMNRADVSFVPYECEEEGFLKPVLTDAKDASTVAFMIGPEGGFDEDEIDQIRKNKIPVISLGKRILRTETAGEAVLSMVMYEIGDINS